jgi:hypothetical protein
LSKKRWVVAKACAAHAFIEGDEAPSSLAMTSHEAASKYESETKSVSEKAGKQHEATATSVCKTLAAKSDKMMGG